MITQNSGNFRYRTIDGWVVLPSGWDFQLTDHGALVVFDQNLNIHRILAAGEWMEIQRMDGDTR